jgi:flagellar basal-body rod modification protein FlgD
MAAFAGLLNHQMTPGQALTGSSASPMATPTAATSGTSSTSSSDSSSATISANDFLTLLVTEMQNQDPTAQTDPNEYINQLVQVNSLEQLISINQNLSTALGDSGTTAGTPSTSSQGAAGQSTAPTSALTAPGPAGTTAPHANAQGVAGAHKAGATASAHPAGSNTVAAINQFAQSVGAKHAPGNLSNPAANPAAHRVARALDGHSHAPAIPGKLPGAQQS